MGPQELQDLPFEVELNPEPPTASDDWHDIVKGFWESLKTDPARKWMTAADWSMAELHFESMSRDLQDQVVGVTETGEVVKDKVPIKGANLAAYQKLFAVLGIGEANRLRMQKEITLFPLQQVQTEGNVINIEDARRNEVQ